MTNQPSNTCIFTSIGKSMSMLKNPVHPGSILQHEFLEPLSMSSYKLAKCIGVPRTRIERIAAEKTSVSPDTAMRLAKFFGTTPEFWLNLQQGYDLLKAKADTDVSSIKPLVLCYPNFDRNQFFRRFTPV